MCNYHLDAWKGKARAWARPEGCVPAACAFPAVGAGKGRPHIGTGGIARTEMDRGKRREEQRN